MDAYEVNCATGEVTVSEYEETPEQQAADAAAAAAAQTAADAKAAQVAAAKAVLLQYPDLVIVLEALGLTLGGSSA